VKVGGTEGREGTLELSRKGTQTKGNLAQYKYKESNVDNFPHLSTNYEIFGLNKNKFSVD